MTMLFSVNNSIVANPDDCYTWVWYLKNLMKTAGWTVIASGDGSTYDSSDLFTGTPSGDKTGGAGDWSGLDKWIQLREPIGTREVVFWRAASAGTPWQHLVKLSPTGFTDTTNRTASRPPDAADQEVALGTLPTTREDIDGWTGAGAPRYAHCWASNAAQDGVYAWGCYQVLQSSGATTHAAVLEPVRRDPSTTSTDPQPWILYVKGWNNSPFRPIVGSDRTLGPKAYKDYGGGGEVWSTHALLLIKDYTSQFYPGNSGVQEDGYEYAPQIPIGNYSLGHFKGWTQNLRWSPTSGRSYPDTVAGDTYNYVYEEWDVLLPWESGETPQ